MFSDIGKMLKMLGQLKAMLPQMQEKLASSEHTASAGEGAVTATVNGRLALVDLKIDAHRLASGQLDGETLADLIKSAISTAQQRAAEATREALKELTGGMDLPAGLGGIL